MTRWAIAVASAAILVASTLVAGPASAEDPPCGYGCTSNPGSGGGGGSNPEASSPVRSENYSTPSRSCTVYASGAGMGSYCVGSGGGDVRTLRERFGGQPLQLCRYSELPASWPKPVNNRPDEGRYMLMSCLGNIDFDTYAGGRNKTLDLSVVFVPFGTDVADVNNPISDFLWNTVRQSEQLPVPVMVTRPNQTPIVGEPTIFTFRWVDPATNRPVAEGPFAGRPNGGPFKQVTSNGLVLQARATGLRIDPNQRDVKAISCDPSTPYAAGRTAGQQPEGACIITFARSSASARSYATKPIPSSIKDAFYASVEVTWEVRYGESEDNLRGFAAPFTMRLKQVLPVQEIQAPNLPPTTIF